MTDFLSETRLSLTTITLNRPSRRNSISSAMFDGMAAELNRLAADDTVRAVCFKGSDQLFSAGADLDELLKSPKTLTEAMTRFFDALERFPKPLVAEVNGPCVGSAFIAVLYCDMVYASPRALFSIPSVALARTPRFGACSLIVRAAGHAKAAEKILLSEPISAQEALDMHLVTAVIDENELSAAVLAKMARLAVLPNGAVRAAKSVLTATRRHILEAVRPFEEKVYDVQAASAEAEEALKACLEGRKPVFRPE